MPCSMGIRATEIICREVMMKNGLPRRPSYGSLSQAAVKPLLSVVERSDLADVTAEQMEQHLSDPSTVQQLIDFLAQVQWKTTSVFSRSNGWKFTEELRELHPLRYLYNEGDVVYIGADKYEIATLTEEKVYLQNAEFPILGQENDLSCQP